MLLLKIRLSGVVHRKIKNELTKALPEIKSSHRAEVLARCLGFRTNAALLSVIDDEPTGFFDEKAASGYLEQRNQPVCLNPFRLAIGRAAISEATEKEHRLSELGIGNGPPKRNNDGTWESVREHFKRFREDRASLQSDDAVEQFLLCLAFLEQVPRTKTIRPGTGSYRLKHIAEKFPYRYFNGDELGPRYVQNGVFIAAGIHSGFQYRKFKDEYGYDALNVTFNMSKKVIDDLDCELRPDGALAQGRRRRRSGLIYA